MIKTKKVELLKLREGDMVYSGEDNKHNLKTTCKIGIVVEKGRTLLHNHSYVRINWIKHNFVEFINYYLEDNQLVDKII